VYVLPRGGPLVPVVWRWLTVATDMFVCPANLVGAEPDPWLAGGVMVVVVGAAAVLLAQRMWGPRFFLGAAVRWCHVGACAEPC
jgi:hypothetical protein